MQCVSLQAVRCYGRCSGTATSFYFSIDRSIRIIRFYSYGIYFLMRRQWLCSHQFVDAFLWKMNWKGERCESSCCMEVTGSGLWTRSEWEEWGRWWWLKLACGLSCYEGMLVSLSLLGTMKAKVEVITSSSTVYVWGWMRCNNRTLLILAYFF